MSSITHPESDAERRPVQPGTQRAKNDAAKRLIQTWLDDESGYDESVWPLVKQAIEENRESHRKRFSE